MEWELIPFLLGTSIQFSIALVFPFNKRNDYTMVLLRSKETILYNWGKFRSKWGFQFSYIGNLIHPKARGEGAIPFLLPCTASPRPENYSKKRGGCRDRRDEGVSQLFVGAGGKIERDEKGGMRGGSRQ